MPWRAPLLVLALLMGPAAAQQRLIPLSELRSGLSYAGADVRALQADEFGNPAQLWLMRGEQRWSEAVGAAGERFGLVKAGECFGEMALLLSQPRNATVRAVSPCDLLVLDAEDFRRIIADFPQAEADLRQIAASRR